MHPIVPLQRFFRFFLPFFFSWAFVIRAALDFDMPFLRSLWYFFQFFTCFPGINRAYIASEHIKFAKFADFSGLVCQ